MAKLFATSINLNKNELQNARIQNLGFDPLSPVTGQIYFNTTDNELRCYDGAQWVSGGGTTVQFGTTISRPPSGTAGQIYVDIEAIAIYVDNGSTWIQGTVSAQDVTDVIVSHGNVSSGVHGVTGTIVGTSDTQTLTNKTVNDELMFTNPSTIPNDGGIKINDSTEDFEITAYVADLNLYSNNGDINLNPDGVTNVDSQLNVSGNLNVGTVAGSTVNSDGSLTLQDGNGASQIHINGTTNNIELLPAGTSKAFYGSSATSGNEIARIADLQAISSGLSWKQSVHLLWDDVNASNSGNSGTLTIDGHETLTSAHNGYRILIPFGETAGIWSFNDNGVMWELTRTADADTVGELIGAALFVMEGDVYGATSWVQSNHHITDYYEATWNQFSGQGTYIGSNSIQVDGNQINVVADNSRGLAIDGDGLYISTGLGTSFGEYGSLNINAGTGFDVSSGVLEFATGYGIRKHTATIGDGQNTSYEITHNLGTYECTVQVRDTLNNQVVETDIELTSANIVTIGFASAPEANSYKVVIVG